MGSSRDGPYIRISPFKEEFEMLVGSHINQGLNLHLSISNVLIVIPQARNGHFWTASQSMLETHFYISG